VGLVNKPRERQGDDRASSVREQLNRTPDFSHPRS
jgi:hypothetical protein